MDNLDDLATGGRVTRSLRKRLNSLDSEASSSRCGTPTNQKLPPITEVSTVSSRIARVNTPIKTPSKGRGVRGVTPDVNSPAKRLTRRFSINIIEDEHSKTNVKEPEFEVLPEDVSKSVSKTRAAQMKTTNANSSIKRMTRRNSTLILEDDELKEENLETFPHVEEVVLVSNSENTTTSPTKENALKSEQVQNSSYSKSVSPTKLSNNSANNKLSSKQPQADVQIISLMSDDSSNDVENVVELKPTKANDTSKQQNETENNKSHISPRSSNEVVYIKKLTQSDIARYTSKPTESGKDNTKETITSPTQITKTVSLNASDDNTEKKKYPKTPAITKSKSYIDNNSSKEIIAEEDTSFTSGKISRANLKMSKDDTEFNSNEPNSSKESAEFHDATDVHMISDSEQNEEDVAGPSKTSFSFAEKTPYKTKLSSNVKSSTPFVESVTADKNTELREREKEDNKNAAKNVKENCSDEDVHNKSGSTPKHSFELDLDLLTPEKYLRSGKTYGSTPPLISPRDSPSLHNKSAASEAEKEKSTSALSTKESSKNSNETVVDKVAEEKTPEPMNAEIDNEKNTLIKDKSISADIQVASESTEGKNNEVSFTRSWSPGVSVKTDAAGQKIDTISTATDLKETVAEIVEEKSNSYSAAMQRFLYESDDEEDEESTNEHVGDDENNESDDADEGEKKNEFVDNEAMEAPEGYQSGDSMDEEEREEMEENDIPIGGESLGSNDTDDEDAEIRSEDEDDSKNSFIVEDEEDVLLENSDDDEHLNESEKNKSKRRSHRRIMVPSSESDSDEPEKEISKPKTKTKRQSITGNSNGALVLDVTKMIDESMTDDEINATVQSVKKVQKNDEEEAELELELKVEEEKDSKANESLRLHASEESDSEESMKGLNISKSFNQSQSNKKSDKNVLNSTDGKEKGSLKENVNKSLNTSNRKSNGIKNQNRIICDDESDADEDTQKSSDVAAASKETKDESDSLEEDEEEDNVQQEETDAKKKVKSLMLEEDEDDDDDEDEDEDEEEDEEEEEDIEEKEDLAEKEEVDKDVTKEVEADEDIKEKEEEEDMKDQDEDMEEEDEDMEEEDDDVAQEEDAEENGKSVEQNKENSFRRKTENKKEASEEKDDALENEAKDSDKESDQDLMQQQPITKKRKTLGLSVSFDHKTSSNKVYEVVEENMYSSFTIGVKVNKKPQKALKQVKTTIKAAEDSNSETASNVQQLISSDEEEQLERLKHNEKNPVEQKQQRRTLVTSDGNLSSVKRRKLERNSICLPIDEETPMSRSFTQTISNRKRTVQQQLPTPNDEENAITQTKVETSKEQIEEPSSTSDSPTKSDVAKKSDNSIQYILSRCDEILGAANEAKLEAKRNFKKSKVRQRKKQSSKHNDLVSADTSEATESDESVERKRKEKVKEVVEQALKASVNILQNPPNKKKVKDFQAQNLIKSEDEERKIASKRLPDNLLAAIAKDEHEHVVKKNEKKVMHKEQENLGSVKKINSAAGEFIELPLTPKHRKKIAKIETAAGPVIVEPLTPKRKTNFSGFRESPVTPRTIGFKVSQILTAGQDMPPTLGASSSSSSARARKRRFNIDEPTHTLPRRKWTKSGAFLEQDIPLTRHINVSGCATQFMVSALDGPTKPKKFKSNSSVASSSINAGALHFKETALMRSNVKRESSRELLLRKHRLNEHRSKNHAN